MLFNLRLIPLLPFIGATLLFLFGRRWKRDTVVLVAVVGGVVVARSHKKEVAAEQAAERRKIIEQLARADFPALDAGGGDAHGGAGGHH